MRNFSMKKFGTPGRAGPGVATDTVGFSSVGDPSVLRVGLSWSTCLSVSLSLSGCSASSSPSRASVFSAGLSFFCLAFFFLASVCSSRARVVPSPAPTFPPAAGVSVGAGGPWPWGRGSWSRSAPAWPPARDR